MPVNIFNHLQSSANIGYTPILAEAMMNVKLGKNKDHSPAPAAQLIGYFSRKGAKERKARKGRKRGVCILSALVNYTLRSLSKPFSSLPSSLCVLGVLCAFARGITGGTAP
jgi:hypothetical protein